MNADDLKRCDFVKAAVHEAGHAVIARSSFRSLSIRRHKRGGLTELNFKGQAELYGAVTPQIAIAGKLAEHLYSQFNEENGSGEWPEDLCFWVEDFVDLFSSDAEYGAVSGSDLEPLPKDFDSLCELVETTTEELKNLWPRLLAIVGALLEQFENDPHAEMYDAFFLPNGIAVAEIPDGASALTAEQITDFERFTS
jgi:hypothetical protein